MEMDVSMNDETFDPNDEVEDDNETVTTTFQPGHSHKLSVEDEFLLMLMKLRMGPADIDLSERFNVSESVVNIVFLIWINYVYITLGSIKIWPHRSIIIANSPPEFLDKYPNIVIIIHGTMLKIQTPCPF